MWKEIIVYNIVPGRYFINSESGDIFDMVKKDFVTRQVLCGYYTVQLSIIDGKHKSFRVHRLVLATFSLCRPADQNIANHLDTNKMNNNINNLEYTTVSGNTRHAIENHCRKLVADNVEPLYEGTSNKAGNQNGRNGVLTEWQVHEICKLMEQNTPYPKILELLGLPVQKNLLDILTKIRSKKLWYCVSKYYNIPNKEYRDEPIHYTEEQIHSVCKLIKEGYNCPQMANMLGIPFTPQKEADKFRHFVKRIKDKKTFVEISNQYF